MVAALTASQIFWPFLTLVAVLGLFAIFFPRQFRVFAYRSSKWVDTDQVLAKLDRRVDVDHLVLRHARLFGAVVLAACALLLYLYATYGLIG